MKTMFWKKRSNVEKYLSMENEYDAQELIDAFQNYVAPSSSVLELGMGPGNDFRLLSRNYRMTGSDISAHFLTRYTKIEPDADLLELDVRTLKTSQIFDALYSNKVLIHLTRDELTKSFEKQAHLLKPGGFAFHTFWKGKDEKIYEHLLFTYYTHVSIKERIDEENWMILLIKDYSEVKRYDSFYILLKKI